jgi:hypothetical protein
MIGDFSRVPPMLCVLRDSKLEDTVKTGNQVVEIVIEEAKRKVAA